MAESGILREFLVGLGFKVDEKSLKSFRDGVENATRAVQRLSVTVAAAATAMSAGVTLLASRLERLDFTSNRVKASASNLKALEQTAKNFGIEAQAAVGSVEALAKALRNNPGVEAYAQSLGVRTREANGDLRDRVEILTDLSAAVAHMPDHLRDRFAGIFGVDPELMRKAADPRFAEEQKRRAQFLKDNGFDQAGKDAHGFMTAVRELGWRFEMFGLQVQGALIKKLGPALDRLMTWIEKHGPRMAGKLADVAERLLDAVVQLAPYLGMFIDKFLELDEATGGWSTSLLAVLAVLKMLGGASLIGGILQLAGAMRGVAGAAAGGMGLARLTGVGTAAAGGWWLGGKIYDNLLAGTTAGDKIGEGVARVLAFFGSETAEEALRANGKSGQDRGVKTLADSAFAALIAKGESGVAGYNAVNRGAKHGYTAGVENLESMTVAEVMAAQRQGRFNAAGRYQIIGRTLAEGVKRLGLTGEEKFDKATQDRLFEQYLIGHKRKAIAEYISGKSDDLTAALTAIAQEWASVADPKTGKSYYDKDGVNRASVSAEAMGRALSTLRLQGTARLGGDAVRGGMTQTNHVNVTVTGAQSPEATGRAVAEHVVYQEENLARTMPGVTY